MGSFDFRSFSDFALRVFGRKNVKFNLTFGKWILVFILSLFYILFEVFTWFCFFLDDLFFPDYRKISQADQSVFIIGNPRSGTTFLQRLLSKDETVFTSMKMWEILFAPSITQRKIIQVIMRTDQRIGSPIKKISHYLDEKWRKSNRLHRISLVAPEEDQFLFIHNWSTISVWLFGGMVDNLDSYLYFDEDMPAKEIKRIMTFYKKCIQRHLYFHADRNPDNIRYLSKNPSASPKIDSLYHYFPDAKVIYLVRNPLDMIPSYISMLDFTWDTIGDLPGEYGGKGFVLEMAKHWYCYPLQRLDKAPADSYYVVKFDDLVNNPQETIHNLYRRFGLRVSEEFDKTLNDEAQKSRSYQSKHSYSLSAMGLDQKKLEAEFKYVFDRFDFDTA
jgi:hypothetical protein